MSVSPEAGLVVALINDLIFGTKIVSTGSSLGVSVATLHSVAEVERAMAQSRVSLLIVDLNSAGDAAIDAVRAAAGNVSRPRIVAFVSHIDVDLAERARTAGADDVMPRSRFSQTLPQILADHATASPSGESAG